jgi:hypothetical protein
MSADEIRHRNRARSRTSSSEEALSDTSTYPLHLSTLLCWRMPPEEVGKDRTLSKTHSSNNPSEAAQASAKARQA